MEIPSKDNPYDPEKDTIVVRAAGILWGSDTGSEKLKEMQAAGGKWNIYLRFAIYLVSLSSLFNKAPFKFSQ